MLGFLLGQATLDPQLLPIGPAGTVRVDVGSIVRTSNGKRAKLDDIVRACRGKRAVLIGESHDQAPHHQFQADVIAALARSGRPVIVGFEMFTRPVQDKLMAWPLGFGSEEQFIADSQWKTQWGFDFGIYRPIFNVTREFRLPMVALNVPRDWVRSVGKLGLPGLNPEQRQQLPADIDLGNKEHRMIFDALMGGHPPTGPMGENIYAAQVLWDVGMADSAAKALTGRSPDTIIAIVAGNGHVMYGQGIAYRLKGMGVESQIVVCTEADGTATVAKGIADFVYASKATKKTE